MDAYIYTVYVVIKYLFPQKAIAKTILTVRFDIVNPFAITKQSKFIIFTYNISCIIFNIVV